MMALFGPKPEIVAKLGLIKFSCSLEEKFKELVVFLAVR